MAVLRFHAAGVAHHPPYGVQTCMSEKRGEAVKSNERIINRGVSKSVCGGGQSRNIRPFFVGNDTRLCAAKKESKSK